MSPSAQPQDGQFRNAELAELRHSFRALLDQVLSGTEVLLEEAATLGKARILEVLRHIHSAGRAALAEVNEALSNRDAVDPGELELLSAKIRPRAERMMIGLEGLRGETGTAAPEEWREDVDRLMSAGRSLLALSNAAPIEQPVEAEATQYTEAVPGEARRILVAGGEALERGLLCRRLVRQGYQPGEAENASVAFDRIAEQPFDLVMIDLMMPAMSGFELLERIKSDRRLRTTPVLVIAPFDERARVVRAIQTGAEDYISKPFEAALLRTRINNLLERRRLSGLLSAEIATPAGETLDGTAPPAQPATPDWKEPLDSVIRLTEVAAFLAREQCRNLEGLGNASADLRRLCEIASQLEESIARIREHSQRARAMAAAAGLQSPG